MAGGATGVGGGLGRSRLAGGRDMAHLDPEIGYAVR